MHGDHPLLCSTSLSLLANYNLGNPNSMGNVDCNACATRVVKVKRNTMVVLIVKSAISIEVHKCDTFNAASISLGAKWATSYLNLLIC